MFYFLEICHIFLLFFEWSFRLQNLPGKMKENVLSKTVGIFKDHANICPLKKNIFLKIINIIEKTGWRREARNSNWPLPSILKLQLTTWTNPTYYGSEVISSAQVLQTFAECFQQPFRVQWEPGIVSDYGVSKFNTDWLITSIQMN